MFSILSNFYKYKSYQNANNYFTREDIPIEVYTLIVKRMISCNYKKKALTLP